MHDSGLDPLGCRVLRGHGTVRMEWRPHRLLVHDVRAQAVAGSRAAVDRSLRHGRLPRRRPGLRRGRKQRLRHASLAIEALD